MVGRSVCAFGLLATALCTSLIGTMSAQSVAVGVVPEASPRVATVTVQVDASPLKDVLQLIAKQAGLTAAYGKEVVTSARRVTLHVRAVPATEAFEKALAGTGFKAAIVADRVVFSEADGAITAVAQGKVTVKVTDAKTKLPLQGATITLDGTGRGVTTSEDGIGIFPSVAPGAHTLNVRLLGYVKAQKTTTVVEGQTASIDIVLDPSLNALDQVIVTGTIVATAQKAVPNAMTIITAKDIERRGITHIDQLFHGDVPGLFAENTGAYSDVDKVYMYSRGASAANNYDPVSGSFSPYTNAIKTYVDGVELSDPSYLSQIDPKSIERIEILAGPQASTVYGSNAINGVMQIFTKRGGGARAQLNLSLLSGFVQNDFRPSLTPQHDYSAQVTGTEGRWSYNMGGSWVYMGPWSPAKQTTVLSGFGGGRMQWNTALGNVTTDASLRIGRTANQMTGSTSQAYTALREAGWLRPTASGASNPFRSRLNGQTVGLTVGYTPTSWWSHEFVLGSDASNYSNFSTAPRYIGSDTMLSYSLQTNQRSSLRYSTTAHMALTSSAQGVVTVGADEWQSLYTSISGTSAFLSGYLTSPVTPTRTPSHNTGAFVQGQLGVHDALFFTYGLRAEWNPNYGADAQPNLSPRYGIAYTQDIATPWGPLTTKLRASYGRSTRPPASGEQVAGNAASSPGWAYYIPYYGPFDYQLANPDLGAEYQQGGEGGIEFYAGQRASLVITRYNQTVDGLIMIVKVDSIRSNVPNPPCCAYDRLDADGYGIVYPWQYLNVASIRNQGWELQGTLNTGPFTTRGTYSWTKSRVIGVTEKYRSLTADPQIQPGKSFSYLAEHTWALGVSYALGGTTVDLNLNGTGRLDRESDSFTILYQSPRLTTMLPVAKLPSSWDSQGAPYALANLNASHRFSAGIEGVLQVQNLMDSYENDLNASNPVMGRQTKMGFRIRL